jgi:hypothetical protein
MIIINNNETCKAISKEDIGMTRFHAPSEFLAELLANRLSDNATEMTNRKLVWLADYRSAHTSKRSERQKRGNKPAPCQIIDFVGGARGG